MNELMTKEFIAQCYRANQILFNANDWQFGKISWIQAKFDGVFHSNYRIMQNCSHGIGGSCGWLLKEAKVTVTVL